MTGSKILVQTDTKFDQYYRDIYGEKWDDLKSALLLPEQQMIRSCFGSPRAESPEQIHGFPLHSEQTKGIDYEKNEQGLKTYYIMDPASYLSSIELPISKNDFVLDMCAAPGGKSLILLEQLQEGKLWVNEISAARRERLKSVIRDYTPKTLREHVFIKGKDGIRYGIQNPEEFDKVLLDAPCSSERHVLKSPAELSKWSPKRTKKLAQIQYGLLCSALLACKKGGIILYSTCSISPLENDGVIAKLIHKKGGQFSLLHDEEKKGFYKTDHGYFTTPLENQIGPIYFCLIKKNL